MDDELFGASGQNFEWLIGPHLRTFQMKNDQVWSRPVKEHDVIKGTDSKRFFSEIVFQQLDAVLLSGMATLCVI